MSSQADEDDKKDIVYARLRPYIEEDDDNDDSGEHSAADGPEAPEDIIARNQVHTDVDGVQRGPISEAVDSQATEWQSKLHQFVTSREKRRAVFDSVVDTVWAASGRLRFATIPLYFLRRSISFSDIFHIGENEAFDSMYLPNECRLQFMDSVQMSVVERTAGEEEFVARFDVIVSHHLRGEDWRGLAAVDPSVLKHFSDDTHGGCYTAPTSSSASSSSSTLLSSSSLSAASSTPTAASVSSSSSATAAATAMTAAECEALVSIGLALEYACKYDEALIIWQRLYAARHHYGLFKIGVRYLRGWRMPLSFETAIYLFEQAVVASARAGSIPSRSITPALPYLLAAYRRAASSGAAAGAGYTLWICAQSFGKWLLHYWKACCLSRLLAAEASGEPPVPWSVRVYREAGARYSAQLRVRNEWNGQPLALIPYRPEVFSVPVFAPFFDIDLLWTQAVGVVTSRSAPAPWLLERRYPPALYAEGEEHMPLDGTCNLPRAAALFEEAAAAGVADACYRLGYMYATGYGIDPYGNARELRERGHRKKNRFMLDKHKALELLTLAANAKHRQAEDKLNALRRCDQMESKKPAKRV